MPQRKPISGAKKLAPMPPDLLARAYLDILAREAGAKAKPMLPGAYSDAALERLIDDLEGYAGDTASARLRPDLAAVAILMARAIEAEPGLAGQLRRDAPVVVMTIHSPNLAETAREVAQECVLPQHSRVLDVESSTLVSPQTRGILVVRDGTAKPDRRDKGSREVTSALQYRIPIMGIAPDPSRHLPQALTRTAVFKLTLPSLDQAGVALVVEAVTGLAPTRAMDPDLVRMLDIDDLPLAFRFGLRGGMFTHVMIGSNDLERSRDFYDATFAALGGEPGEMDARGRLIYAHDGGRLMITKPIDGNPATFANGGTIGIAAASREHVQAWHDAGAAHGGTSIESPPSERSNGAFVAYIRDPDGNKLTARSQATR